MSRLVTRLLERLDVVILLVRLSAGLTVALEV